MDVYYNVEIQMSGTNEVTEELLTKIEQFLGADSTDVDECETYRAVLFFKSPVKTLDMFKRLRELMYEAKDVVHYIDVIYRWETEMYCDRFVIWDDGNEKEYTGDIIFTEDK